MRDDAEIRRVARELGAQAFFRKPVDAAALLDSTTGTRAEGQGKAELIIVLSRRAPLIGRKARRPVVRST